MPKTRLMFLTLCVLVGMAVACYSPEKQTRKKQASADFTAEQIAQGEKALQQKGNAYDFATGRALDRATNQEPAIDLAKEFNSKSQVLHGPPTPEDAATMQNVVDGRLSPDAGEQRRAEKLESRFLDVITKISQEKAENESKLKQELAVLKEQNAQNADDAQKWREYQRKHWLKRIFATLGIFGTIAGLVALVIFFPPALRIIGWLVGKIPALATAAGTVSVKTFDAAVVGVGNVRNHFKLNKGQQYTGEEVQKIIDQNLAAATDADHRKVIEARREKLGVDYVHVNEVPK